MTTPEDVERLLGEFLHLLGGNRELARPHSPALERENLQHVEDLREFLRDFLGPLVGMRVDTP